MNRNIYTTPELVFEAFAEGDEAAWNMPLPPAWAALQNEACDQWRAIRVRNRKYVPLGELSMRSNDPAVGQGLIGIASAQRKFEYSYKGSQHNAEDIGAAASQFGLHVVIHFSDAPALPAIDHPGFRRVLRFLAEDPLNEGPILDTCYTAGGGPGQPTVFEGTPLERTEGLLEQLAGLPRPADPQLVTELLLKDCLDLSIWPQPSEHDKITDSTPELVIQDMGVLHQNGLFIPG